MAELKSEPMSAEAFLAWCLDREERYELVDGLPRMMTGARRAHDRVVLNALIAFGGLLRGSPCEPGSADIAVRIPNGNVRRPDVSIDCGDKDGSLLEATRPVAIVEVLSPSTRQTDLIRKLGEYQTLPSLCYLLFLEPEEVSAVFWHRVPGGTWTYLSLIGRDTDIAMPEVGVTLPLGAFYEGTDA
ncbi:Uma2 family endonuclease [Methylobrevis albus]|nr:Uma2 family endonuclease [Methylobrevis albus]